MKLNKMIYVNSGVDVQRVSLLEKQKFRVSNETKCNRICQIAVGHPVRDSTRDTTYIRVRGA